MNRTLPGRVARAGSVLSLSLLAFAYADVTTGAQDRLKTMPGYAQFQKVGTQLNGAMRSGAINGTWSADSSSVEYVLCLLYTSPSPRDISGSRMPSSA